MTIQKRAAQSYVIMLVVPLVLGGLLLALGGGVAMALLQYVYLPRVGLSLHDLHMAGEEIENLFPGLKLLTVGYYSVVVALLVAAVVYTDLRLTRSLYTHITEPLDELVQGVQRIRDGDLETPIAYTGADEFKAACDAVDEMAARLRASLAEQQLQQQKKQELIAGMSHDLKSPLAAIRAYTEALLEGVAQDEAARKRYLETIYARETQLESLVNRLFELAKLGTGTYPVHLEPLPARETLETMAQRSDEGLDVTIDVTDGETVVADRELLARVVSNLLDNSRKYGATAMQISLTQDGAQTELRFADNGPGVDEAQLPKLFDAFYRGDAARTKPGAGSGLGLAVVREAAEKMHGAVRAENAPGGGLCVLLTLPTVQEETNG